MLKAPDIFLSYSREDAQVARRVAEALEQEGFQVWWDQALNAGDAYDRITEQALESAGAVLVLCSRHSVESRWVRAEATTADRRGTLVPAMIESCKRPIMFELTQSADLSSWKGDRDDPAWRALLASLRRFVPREASAAPLMPPAAPARPARSRTPRLWLLAMLALALVGPGLWLLRNRADSPTGVAAGVTADASIAVLPFESIAEDSEEEAFADGLSEELLDQLTKSSGLRVIGRRSAFAFKGRNEDLRTIGQILGVTHILEGSVRKAGDRLRITAQLINAADGSSLWSERYERRFEDIFAIQDEIARAVARQLDVALGRRPTEERGTNNLAAYDAYLAGRTLIARNALSVPEGIVSLERAVELDPGYIAPRAHLVGVYFSELRQTPAERAEARARRATHMAESSRARLTPRRPPWCAPWARWNSTTTPKPSVSTSATGSRPEPPCSVAMSSMASC